MNVSKPGEREGCFEMFFVLCKLETHEKTNVGQRVDQKHLHIQAAAMSLAAAYGGSHVGKSGCTK